MRKVLTITGILLVFLCPAQEKKLSALRIHSTVKIDGNLDEAVWKQAAVADSFIANLPRYGEPCSQRTIVHIIYDDQAVYIGAYLYDEPGLIRRQLTSRDGEQRKDTATVVNGIYNFTSRMNLSLRARHYWSKVIYESFYFVDANGNLLPHVFVNGKDQNFNAFNLDMFYTWDFKYGSKLIVGYKNWLGNDFPINGSKYKNYTGNLAQVFQQPHGNELTVRLIYYIDYLTLQKKRSVL